VNARIIVFAKAPVPGRVKTRLDLDPAHAAALHTAFVRDTLETVAGLGDLELCTDIETGAWDECGAARSLQCEGSLGERLYTALAGALGGGYRQAMILGSDSPTLPAAYPEALLAAAADVALGPTEDGGYYAIACRRVAPGMFDGVEWSTSRTRAMTMEAATRAGLTVELGPEWYDIDEPRDLDRLAATPGLPRHTLGMLGWLQQLR
jgi:uncharacterized protein